MCHLALSETLAGSVVWVGGLQRVCYFRRAAYTSHVRMRTGQTTQKAANPWHAANARRHWSV